MATVHRYFATCPRGGADLLAAELGDLGAESVKEAPGGVGFAGTLAAGYGACLWSRIASRVLLEIAEFQAPDADALYAGAHAVPWETTLRAGATIAVDFTGTSPAISHTHFGALRVKDAVVDRLRERTGARPDVDPARPDLRINVHLHRDRAALALDLSGDSLHRRGYRERSVAAPLKENLAAAILLRAGWPALAARGAPLVDPLCGSGTLAIEGAFIACDVAPGLLRERWGFEGWQGHAPALWAALLEQARARREAGLARGAAVHAQDADPEALRATMANVKRAGVDAVVRVARRALDDAAPPAGSGPGLIVANPPYGERLGETEQIAPLYATLGRVLRERFGGWQAVVLTGNPDLGKSMGLRAWRVHDLFNGPIACRLLRFEVAPRWFVDAPPDDGRPRRASDFPAVAATPGGEMFANRLRKNQRGLGKWARREGIDCYRVYDADMPEYALAVDLYATEDGEFVHVQEYEAPPGVERHAARRRLREALAAIPEVLAVAPERVVLKVRRRQKGSSQYARLGESRAFHVVHELGSRFLVNFTDYLDTGLFLDHRLVRRLVSELARERSFLNLFAYTGTATVHAARGGCTSSTTVDLSRTYLDWAQRNFDLNGLDASRHALVEADCLAWLGETRSRRYGLIFLDPPTFSNSKRMRRDFDVQRDHVELLTRAARLLEPDGVLLFSNNFRRFTLDEGALPELRCEDVTRATLPRDFARNPRIHRCWRITRR